MGPGLHRLWVLCGQGSLCSGMWGYSLGSSRRGYFGLASVQGIQNMYLPVGEVCSFIPLFLDDGKVSPLLGMGVRWWQRLTQSLLLETSVFGQCLLPFRLSFSPTSMAALWLLLFFWTQICANSVLKGYERFDGPGCSGDHSLNLTCLSHVIVCSPYWMS